MVEIKKKYLRQMPVKTFFEIIRKRAEEYKAESDHSSYDFQSEMHSHMAYFREWTDTLSLLDDIIGSQALEGTGTEHDRNTTPGPWAMKSVEISTGFISKGLVSIATSRDAVPVPSRA